MPSARDQKKLDKKAAKKAAKKDRNKVHVPLMDADAAEASFYSFADDCNRVFRSPQPPGTCAHYPGNAQAEAFRKRVQADFARHRPDEKMPDDEPTHAIVRNLYGEGSHMLVACQFYEYQAGMLPQGDLFFTVATSGNWALIVNQIKNLPVDKNGDVEVDLMKLCISC